MKKDDELLGSCLIGLVAGAIGMSVITATLAWAVIFLWMAWR
jgi:hypothetical protein